jgi:3-hydroxybutyryl-CoA dehydratase
MPEPKEHEYDSLSLSDTASFTVTVTADMVTDFAALSGDHNPLHLSEEYAAHTDFGARIPHGMLAGAWFSRLVGMELPGLHALYMSQSLAFHAPLPFGVPLQVKGEVIQKIDSARAIKLRTTVLHDATVLVQGEALVRLLK